LGIGARHQGLAGVEGDFPVTDFVNVCRSTTTPQQMRTWSNSQEVEIATLRAGGTIMATKQELVKIAVLDDYQNVALSMADWSVLDGRASVTVFNDHLSDPDAVVARLEPFDVVCVMRERTPMTRAVILRLPRLRLIASTAPRNASIDLEAAGERGIKVVPTGYFSSPTIELTWALILASARSLVARCTRARALRSRLRRSGICRAPA
jgi:D-isomer specific 2-hydroxyacid dehydrogenase, catalytic domain